MNNDKEIRKDIEQINVVATQQKKVGTVFFLSFDIVNSTQFKTIEPEKWGNKIKSFYSQVERNMEDIAKNTHLWKKLGDEVLIYFTLDEIDKLYECIENIFSISQELITNIQQDVGKSLLSIKTTIWVALVSEGTLNNENALNLAISSNFQFGYDFIGPDIDFGFRIAGESAGGILCVDPKIVAMLLKSSKENYILKHWTKFKIINLVQLKGIWRDRFVPIVWYHPEIEKPENIFPYDEKKRNKSVRLLLNKKTPDILDISEIDKVFIDIDKTEMIDNLINGMNNFDIEANMIQPNRIAEVHMVAILLNKEKNKFFCAKRSSSRPILANCWEHGCCQLKRGIESPEEMIKKQYKDDFGIEIIEFKKDGRLEGDELYILCTYSFKNKYGNLIPGFIVTGIADEKCNVKRNSQKHSQLKWMSLEEIVKLESSECVLDFRKHIEIAQSLWKEETMCNK